MWVAVTLHTDAAHAEILSDALLTHGAISVSVEDADAGGPNEKPQFGEPGAQLSPLWESSRLVALFEPQTSFAPLIAESAAAAGLAATPSFTVAEVAEQNWVQLTQAQFEPIRINQLLWIVPSWHAAPDSAAINLVLDPGMAFGTGSHPTTRLCLEWLCQHLPVGASVLDYGCGSGILGIAAAKLGALQVTGIDIDAQALTAARDNAARNEASLRFLHSSQALHEQFDCVLANILTNPLCILAPLLAGHVKTDGSLILSGVLDSQAQQVIAAYAPYLRLEVSATLDGWVLLAGQKT